jgi:hypothetical protein
LLELLQRDYPAAKRDTPPGESGARTRDGHGDSRGGGFLQGRDDIALITRNENALRMSSEARGVLEISGTNIGGDALIVARGSSGESQI